jgi:hypothetical protein
LLNPFNNLSVINGRIQAKNERLVDVDITSLIRRHYELFRLTSHGELTAKKQAVPNAYWTRAANATIFPCVECSRSRSS